MSSKTPERVKLSARTKSPLSLFCLFPDHTEPHAPFGRQSPRSPGNRTHLGQLPLDRMGTPFRDPHAPCCFLCNNREVLHEHPRCQLVTTCPGTQAEHLGSLRSWLLHKRGLCSQLTSHTSHSQDGSSLLHIGQQLICI